MNSQQMEVRVLRAENSRLKEIIEAIKLQSEKEKSIENFLSAALNGYCTQARAASEDYWEKDHGTGVMTPKQGGPKWAAQMALQAMNAVVLELESIVQNSEPQEEKEQPEPRPAEGPWAEGATFVPASEEFNQAVLTSLSGNK